MLACVEFDGVLPDATPAQIVLDALDRQLGQIPGWVVMAEPAYRGAGGLLNRARGAYLAPTTALADSQFVADVGGRLAYAIDTSSTKGLVPAVALDPNAWTWVGVLRVTTVGATGVRDLIRPLVANAGVPPTDPGVWLGPRISLRTSGQLTVYGSTTSTIRLTISASSIPVDTPFLLMVTVSVTTGVVVWINGVIVGSAPTDLRPLNDAYGAGQYVLLGANSGTGLYYAYRIGILNADLSASLKAGDRKIIEQYCRAAYGISAIAAV